MRNDASQNTGINPSSLKTHCIRVLNQALSSKSTKMHGVFGPYISLNYLPGKRDRDHPDKIHGYAFDTAGVLELALKKLTGDDMVFRVTTMFNWSSMDAPCTFLLSMNPLVHDSRESKYDAYKDQGIEMFLAQNKKRLEEEIDKVIAKNFKTQKMVQ